MTTGMNTTTTKPLKPVRHITGAQARAIARRRVRTYELRYEMSTDRMREVVERDPSRETAEVAKWLTEASILELLERRAKSTAGSASTRISKSTKAR
jgi:hypothetical protein